MRDFDIVEALHQWSRLKQNFSGKPFSVLPTDNFGNLLGYSMVLIP